MNGDLRFVKTEKAIRKAFLKLLSKKNINEIYVSEICKLAECNRNTFYLHYEDKYFLMDTISNEFLDECFCVLDDIASKKIIDDYMRETNAVYDFLVKNAKMLLLLKSNDSSFSEKFNKRIADKEIEIIRNMSDKPLNEKELLGIKYFVYGYSGCILEECCQKNPALDFVRNIVELCQTTLRFVNESVNGGSDYRRKNEY